MLTCVVGSRRALPNRPIFSDPPRSYLLASSGPVPCRIHSTNGTRFVITSIAAISIAGALGLAYAQIATPSPRSGSPNMHSQTAQAMQPPSADAGAPDNRNAITGMSRNSNGVMSGRTPISVNLSSMPATTITSSNDGSAMAAERPARSHRN